MKKLTWGDYLRAATERSELADRDWGRNPESWGREVLPSWTSTMASGATAAPEFKRPTDFHRTLSKFDELLKRDEEERLAKLLRSSAKKEKANVKEPSPRTPDLNGDVPRTTSEEAGTW